MLAAALVLLATGAAAQSSAGTATGSGAQTLDRVVAAVGNAAITASDVEAEYRLELFLDGKEPEGGPGADILNQVRQRMIDRILLEDEVQTDSIKVSPDDPAVVAHWSELQKKFPSAGAFASALGKLGMSEEALKSVLAEQEAILRLIDQRLRPEAVVEPPEIEAYYRDTFVPSLAQQGSQPAPPLSDVESRIREILVQQKVNGLLEQWLKRLRNRGDVRVFGSAEAGGPP
jgi:peptidyl-prolyl cis-trans isomerase SurA